MNNIENISIDLLIPYIRNSRTHSEAQIAQIAASIKEFGFTNPVLIDADDGIIAGHGRVLAARKLNIDVIPCVRLSHLTEIQKRAYVIADNKLALNAVWDDAMLAVEFSELEALGFDVMFTGFDVEELSLIQNPVINDLCIVDEIKEECGIKIICTDYNEQQMAIAKLGGKKISWFDLEGLIR